MSRRWLALLGLPVLVGVGCGTSFTGTQVVSVNGEDISRDTLEGEFDALTDNAAYRSLLEQQLQGVAIGSSEGSFDAQFVANLLTERVYLALVDQEIERLGLSVGEEALDSARTTLEQNIGAPFTDLPATQQDQFVARVGLVITLQNDVVPDYFERHQDDYDELCTRHILVSTEANSPDDARERAEALADDLAGGADFAELAVEESDDEQSAVAGGDLGCQPRGFFVPPFEEAAYGLELDEVSEPVATEFGYHLILVEDRNPTELTGQEQRVQSDVIDGLTEEAEVEVNPRYGRWTRPTPDGSYAVVPPENPIVADG